MMICTYSAHSPCLIVGLIACFLPLSNAQSPGILAGPTSQTWNINLKDRQLVCVAYPKTGVRITWIKDGVEILQDEHISINAGIKRDRLVGALMFRRLEKSDEGSYQCIASNVVGSKTSKRAKIKISGPPVVNVDNPLPSSISVKWHDQFALQCDGRGPPDITVVEWTYKAFVKGIDQLSIAFEGEARKRKRNPSLNSLPREDDAMRLGVVRYEVFCTVHNQYGSQKSQTTTIYIKQRPQTPVVERVTTLDSGKDIKLLWKIVSSPAEIDTCEASFNRNEITKKLAHPYKSTVNEQIIGGFVPKSSYSVRIRCGNGVGTSEYSESYEFITESGIPDTPSNVVLRTLNTTALRVSWTAIASDQFCGVLVGYRIKLQKKRGADTLREVAPDEYTSVFHNLIPGGTYGAGVLGFTSSMDGPYSVMQYVTLPLFDNLLKPVITVSDVSEKQAIFTTQDLNVKDGAFHNCSLFLSDGIHDTTVDVELARKARNRTMRLMTNIEYTVKVGCYTYDMKRMYSDTKRFRTKEGAPSLSPENLGVTISNQSILAKWSAVTADLNGNFTAYNVCTIPTDKNAGGDKVCFNSVGTYYTFTNVQPGMTYTVLVSACTNAGCGPSAFKVITTDNWSMPSTTGPSVTVPTMKPTAAGLSEIIYIVMAVLIVIIIIVVIAVVCKKRSYSQKDRTEAPVMFTASAGEQPYEVPLLHPTWTETNTYSDIPSLPSPTLSQETYDKLANVKYGCDCVSLIEVIGKGEFGRVYKAEFSPSKQPDARSDVTEVAVKTMIMQVYEQSEYEEFVREGLRMKNMDHPNVMRLLGICLPTESNMNTNNSQSGIKLSGLEMLSPWVIVPYMPNGDLKHYLYHARMNEEKKIGLKQILQFGYDIACGMEYLAAKQMIHRDLACRNCMLDANMHVVVSDFGLSRQVYSSSYYVQRHAAKMPVKWMAIESLMDRVYTSMTDVWSFGVTAWELFTLCQNPFPGVQNHEMLDVLKAGTRLSKPEFCPNDVWNDAVYPCWDPRPEERPTFTELAEMFAGFKKYHHETAAEPSQDIFYVNVKPAGDYEKLKSRSNTVSSENNEVPMSYESAVQRLPSGKLVPKRGRASSKKPLLDRSHTHSDGSEDVVDL